MLFIVDYRGSDNIDGDDDHDEREDSSADMELYRWVFFFLFNRIPLKVKLTQGKTIIKKCL